MTNREKRRLAAQKAAPAHRADDGWRHEHDRLGQHVDNTPRAGCSDDALQRFTDAAGGAFDAVIIDQPKMLAVAAAAMSGSASDRAYAVAILRCLETWLTEVAERGVVQTCLACGTRFTPPRAPAAFALLMAMSNPGAKASVSGICSSCYAKAETDDDKLALALTYWRKIWPDMQPLAEGGHA